MNRYSVRYYNSDYKVTETVLDAKNLAMLEEIVHRIQYDKSKPVIITSVVWLGRK